MLKYRLAYFFSFFFCFWAMGQQDPLSIPGLEIWVNSDAGVDIFGGAVVQWNDQSGNDNHLTQAGTPRRPVLADAVLNDHPVIRFDGVDDYFDFPELTNIRTVFWVISEDEDAAQSFKCLLGDDDSYNFLRGADGLFWNEQFADEAVLNGETRILGEPIDVNLTSLPSGFKVFTLRTAGPVEASRFSKDRTYNGTVWDGDLAQMLIYSDSLSQQQVEGVEEYLFQYYTSPLDLGDDILITDNFCDTTLVATPGYVDYSWSNGSDNDSLIVNSSGTYWVDATDVFGRVIRDSIVVTYPGNFEPEGNFLCLGENFIWDTGLDPELYDFLWQDNSTEPTFSVDQDSLLSLTVTDMQGCSFSPEPVQVSVDDFSEQISLGEDGSFCIGELISPQGASFPELSFLWSDGSDAPELIYSGQDQIWVEVTNQNGCVAMDTIMTTSLGDAPNAAFSTQNVCFGDITAFTDESSSSFEITSWEWLLGEEVLGNQAEFNYSFESAGSYDVSLIVEDENGCRGEVTQEVDIHQLPLADFSNELICEGQEAQFTDQSQAGDAEITSWSWQYPGGERQEQDPLLSFEESGFQNVSLIVNDALGCTGMYTQLVDVRAAPEVDLEWEGVCQGNFTAFSSIYNENGSGIPVDYDWRFGDATSSSQPDPDHFYALAGNYDVSLEITGINGCSNIAEYSLDIYDPPLAFVSDLDLCEGIEETLMDESIEQSGDPIVEWAWEIVGQGSFGEENPALQIDEQGTYGLSLTVITENACVGSYGNQITVHPQPEFELSFSPEIGAAPLEVLAEVTAEEEYDYAWFYQGNEIGTGNEISINFVENGLETVQLIATSQFGCTTEEFIQIPVEDPVTDLVLVQLEEMDGLHVWVMNNGNYTISDLEFRQAYVGANAAIELVETELAPGEVFEHSLVAAVENDARGAEVLCVGVSSPTALSLEISTQNNEQCLSTEQSDTELFLPFPNPVESEVQFQFFLTEADEVQLSLWNNAGQRVWSTTKFSTVEGYNRVSANLIGLQTGIYLIKLEYRDNEFTEYLMKL